MPSPWMAGVMSKSTPCFKATAPAVASTGPSMAGWLFQVIVRSPHAQLLMAWICPPELLFEPLAADTCRCSLAEVTGCVPISVTLMRRKVRFTGLASATRIVLAPALLVGLAAFTKASAVTVAAGAAGGQKGGGPPTQTPPAEVSAVVDALPSLHGRVFGAFTQPVAGSRGSGVHAFAESQLGAGPPTQVPFAQVSAVVQALPSSHGKVFGGPTHTPAAQVSPEVQGLPSLQGRVFTAFTQPVAGLQESVVHTLPSLQLGGGPPTQTPAAHVSAVVQALPSLQGRVFGVPPTHAAVPLQVLPLMQGLLAQAWPAGSNWQVGEQQSPATRLPSSHCSPRSTTPFPQICANLPMRTVNWLVCAPPTGNPGPSTRKMFWPQGLPVTVWGAAGLPTMPAGGGGATAVRNGPIRPVVSAVPNASAGPAGPAGMRALSWVKLTVPRLSAWSTSTP